MDYLFSPWRFRYVSGSRSSADPCVLCTKLARQEDEQNLILYRGRHNAVILNLFPYTTGHLMILPYAHVSQLGACSAACRQEMMDLATRAEAILTTEYRPDGINLGMNLGEAAGAGIASHIHLHVLPRWFADSNFITVIAETRVIPEDLARTWQRLHPHFAALGDAETT